MPWCNTSRRNKSTIARRRFRRNTASCFAGMASISTSGTFGIEKPRWIETRFQRLIYLGAIESLGRCPRLAMNAAPLAPEHLQRSSSAHVLPTPY